jgi:hypothetical protein
MEVIRFASYIFFDLPFLLDCSFTNPDGSALSQPGETESAGPGQDFCQFTLEYQFGNDIVRLGYLYSNGVRGSWSNNSP